MEDYSIFYIPDVAIEDKKIFPISQEEWVKAEVIIHGIPDWIYEGKYLWNTGNYGISIDDVTGFFNLLNPPVYYID